MAKVRDQREIMRIYELMSVLSLTSLVVYSDIAIYKEKNLSINELYLLLISLQSLLLSSKLLLFVPSNSSASFVSLEPDLIKLGIKLLFAT